MTTCLVTASGPVAAGCCGRSAVVIAEGRQHLASARAKLQLRQGACDVTAATEALWTATVGVMAAAWLIVAILALPHRWTEGLFSRRPTSVVRRTVAALTVVASGLLAWGSWDVAMAGSDVDLIVVLLSIALTAGVLRWPSRFSWVLSASAYHSVALLILVFPLTLTLMPPVLLAAGRWSRLIEGAADGSSPDEEPVLVSGSRIWDVFKRPSGRHQVRSRRMGLSTRSISSTMESRRVGPAGARAEHPQRGSAGPKEPRSRGPNVLGGARPRRHAREP